MRIKIACLQYELVGGCCLIHAGYRYQMSLHLGPNWPLSDIISGSSPGSFMCPEASKEWLTSKQLCHVRQILRPELPWKSDPCTFYSLFLSPLGLVQSSSLSLHLACQNHFHCCLKSLISNEHRISFQKSILTIFIF